MHESLSSGGGQRPISLSGVPALAVQEQNYTHVSLRFTPLLRLFEKKIFHAFFSALRYAESCRVYQFSVPYIANREYNEITDIKEEERMKTLTLVAVVLLVVGGLNWGLVGAFDFNLVDSLLGEGSVLARVVYVLVGLAAVWKTVTLFTDRTADVNE